MTKPEKQLLALQEKYAAERDPQKKALIRLEYIELHRRWVAGKSQLTLERI